MARSQDEDGVVPTGGDSMAVTIYHNRNCGTSRNVLAILTEAGVEPVVVEYLKTPLDAADLAALLDVLEDEPADLVRKDAYFKDRGLDPDDYTDTAAVVGLLVEHPRLMQRPVVRTTDRAFIARPKERALEILA
jgi:arsenate reductase